MEQGLISFTKMSFEEAKQVLNLWYTTSSGLLCVQQNNQKELIAITNRNAMRLEETKSQNELAVLREKNAGTT